VEDRFGAMLDQLEERLGDVERFDADSRRVVFELLDGIDAVHRLALHRLAAAVEDGSVLARARTADPAVEWLLGAYGVGVDERGEAEAALATVRPYVESHGGRLELLEVCEGVVRIRMAGSCPGCAASAVTLSEGVEEALRERLPSLVRVEVEEDDAAVPHAPPGETLVQLGRRPR
jgi:Fe-S cluster biogenesis protein NfuA